MDVESAIETRRSIRRFDSKRTVDDKLVLKLLEYGNLAPSAGNLQSRDFVVVREPERKRRLAYAALDQMFIAEAPVVIVVCGNLERVSPYGSRGRSLYHIQDVSAAVQNILLVATSFGLGTCWIGAFDESEVSRILKLPSHIRPLALIPVGYPAERPRARPRIPIAKLVHHETW